MEPVSLLPRFSPSLDDRGGVVERDKALKAARDFEALFLSVAFKAMQPERSNDPFLSAGEQSWRELLFDDYAKDLAKRGGIGLAEPIARQLLALQEAKNDA